MKMCADWIYECLVRSFTRHWNSSARLWKSKHVWDAFFQLVPLFLYALSLFLIHIRFQLLSSAHNNKSKSIARAAYYTHTQFAYGFCNYGTTTTFYKFTYRRSFHTWWYLFGWLCVCVAKTFLRCVQCMCSKVVNCDFRAKWKTTESRGREQEIFILDSI